MTELESARQYLNRVATLPGLAHSWRRAMVADAVGRFETAVRADALGVTEQDYD
jgi:hypothetical protein